MRGSGGDRYGNRYVSEHLLPAARRALPKLATAVHTVAQALGLASTSVYVPPLKRVDRIRELCHDDEGEGGTRSPHYFHEYPKQASNVDVARAMLVLEHAAQVREALLLFKQDGNRRCFAVVRVLNRFASESGSMRMLSLNLEIDGHFVEVQLALASLVAVRRKRHKYHGLMCGGGYMALIARAKPL